MFSAVTVTPSIQRTRTILDSVEIVFVGYVCGKSPTGQATFYQLGLTGTAIAKVNNNFLSRSAALVRAAPIIWVGGLRCALALGFEQMASNTLGTNTAFPDYLTICTFFSWFITVLSLPCPNRSADRRFHVSTVFDDDLCAARNPKHLSDNPYVQFPAGYDRRGSSSYLVNLGRALQMHV